MKWVGGNNGADRKNGTESMFSAKRKNRSFSTKAAFKLSHNATRQKTRKPISFLMGRQIRAPLTMSYSTNEKMWYKKNKESNLEKTEFIMQKGHHTAIINREKGNSILDHADQIRPQGKYEEQNEEEISAIPSVNDLLKQPSLNETSEDETIHNQVGQNEFENSDEDQIKQEDDLDYSSVRNRSRSPRERSTGERRGELNVIVNQIKSLLIHPLNTSHI